MSDHPITVLGAGIVGICTALALVEKGHAVRVIDRKAPGQETSFGNAGVISPWSVVPQAMPGVWKQIPNLMFGTYKPLSVRAQSWPRMLRWGLTFLRRGTEEQARATSDAMSVLCAPSIDLYRRYLTDAGAARLVKDAMYVHAFRDGSNVTLSSLDYTIRREKGADLELIGADALRALEPALSHDFQAAVLVKGQARATAPEQICQVLAQHAAALGVEFERDAIQSLSKDGADWVIRCEAQTFRAASVVIALGAWSRDVLRPLGVTVPLMAERGYHVEYPSPQIDIANSVMDTDAKVVASSMEGGVRVAGQAEFAPLDAPADPQKSARLRRIAKAMFPDLDTEGEKTWMGRRPSFPDSLPALGQIGQHEGLFANFGHCHYGLMMAPKSGQIIASCVSGRPPNEDIRRMNPMRFAT